MNEQLKHLIDYQITENQLFNNLREIRNSTYENVIKMFPLLRDELKTDLYNRLDTGLMLIGKNILENPHILLAYAGGFDGMINDFLTKYLLFIEKIHTKYKSEFLILHNQLKNQIEQLNGKNDKNPPFSFFISELITNEFKSKPIIDESLKNDLVELEKNNPVTKLIWNDTDWRIVLILQTFITIGYFKHLIDIDIFTYIEKNILIKGKTATAKVLKDNYNRAKNNPIKPNVFIDFTTILNDVYYKLNIDLLQPEIK